MRALVRGIEVVFEAIAAALVTAFAILILADVVFRYVLRIPIPWVSELSVFLFQTTVFLGAVLALRQGLHFGIGIVLARVWPRLATPLGLVVWLIVLLTAVLLAVLAIRMVVQTWDASYATLGISHGWIYVIVACSAGFMALISVEQGYALASARAHPATGADDA
ncbi:MAG: TRAP transporter small permease [Lautropia sp.]